MIRRAGGKNFEKPRVLTAENAVSVSARAHYLRTANWKKMRERREGRTRRTEGESGKREKERKGGREEKIAASGFSRCSWNNFDVCMDEGGTTRRCRLSTPFFTDTPSSDFFRGANLAYHAAAVPPPRERQKLSLNNESVADRLRGRNAS